MVKMLFELKINFLFYCFAVAIRFNYVTSMKSTGVLTRTTGYLLPHRLRANKRGWSLNTTRFQGVTVLIPNNALRVLLPRRKWRWQSLLLLAGTEVSAVESQEKQSPFLFTAMSLFYLATPLKLLTSGNFGNFSKLIIRCFTSSSLIQRISTSPELHIMLLCCIF